MSNTAATQKQLKIKAGIVKRYQKELALYCAEVVENKSKLESITASSGGESGSWDVKNTANLVRESENMVRDTAMRLERAAGELEDLLNSVKRNADLAQNPELLEAEAVLAAGKIIAEDG
ncbi:tubulin binding cofactor A [Russula earlei]|uniref:Tubulin binding cofactor A n=1 Tax=Russula earlei TaxID=71964 RepID=A0ACC0U0C7_9AGAM|nr:tubulin binding cofactor A [Russula earlei]